MRMIAHASARSSKPLGALLLLGLIALIGVFIQADASANHATTGLLPQPFNTTVGASTVECNPHGFEVDADIQTGTVPNGADNRSMCPGNDWSKLDGTAGSGSQQAVFVSGTPDIAACVGNNANVGNPIARNPSFPNSAFGCDDEALSGATDCSTHTNGDKVNDGIYSIVQGGAQPKADIYNFYGVNLDVSPRALVVGFERVTNNGDTHLNFAFKQKGSLLQGLGCPAQATQISAKWSIGDLIANVNYGGGVAQPTVSLFVVECVKTASIPCPGLGNSADIGAADLCQATPLTNLEVDNFCTGTPPATLALTNCNAVQQQNRVVCGTGSSDGSDIKAGFWRSRICAATGDNPSGSAAGCRLSSTKESILPPSGGHPETRIMQRGFIEVRLQSNLINPCFSVLQVQSRASGESVTSALSDVGEGRFPGCSLKIEKRDAVTNDLIPGATFKVEADPYACLPAGDPLRVGTDAILRVTDGATNAATTPDTEDVNDPDGIADGKIALSGVCVGSYTVTEVIAPNGWATNPAGAPCVITPALPDCTAIIYNPTGSLSWEKRDDLNALQGGATFSVAPNPYWCHSDTRLGVPTPAAAADGSLTVVDDTDGTTAMGDEDRDPDAGQLSLSRVCIASYTVTETAAPNSGYALDDDPTRLETVSDPFNGVDDDGDAAVDDAEEFDAVIGTSPLGTPPGTDDPGDTNESDFHNRRGSLAWEKRDESFADHRLQGGATFSVAPDPDDCTDGVVGDDPGPITVVDGGVNDDANGAEGIIEVGPACLATYTIEETMAPNSGYALDDGVSRTCDVTSTELVCMVGDPGDDDCVNGSANEEDFCNRRGTLAWEKRDESLAGNPLQGGATFTVAPNPDDCTDGVVGDDPGPVEVLDNGPLDDNPADGVIEVGPACLASYTITETSAPNAGYALDDSVSRTCDVTSADLACLVGGQGDDDCANATANEQDFCNRRGSLAWEKRDESLADNPLQGAAMFSVSPNPDACVDANDTGDDDDSPVTVVDGGANDDANGVNGVIEVGPACLATYTIEETMAPNSGYALDDSVSRTCDVASDDLACVVGGQTVDDCANDVANEQDFCNRRGFIAWEKRNDQGELQGGATFSVSPNPDNCVDPDDADADDESPIIVEDNGPNDDDKTDGSFTVAPGCLGTYTVTETVAPDGFALDDDPDREVIVDANDLNGQIGEPDFDDIGDTDASDFHNRLGTIEWEKRDDLGALQGGATFTVRTEGGLDGDGNGPFACLDADDLDADDNNPITVADDDDGTLPDSNPIDEDEDAGQLMLVRVCLGDYIITETVAPSGFALDDDETRLASVTELDLNPVVGEQGVADDCPDETNAGDGDTTDFCNRLGSLRWEKRDESQFINEEHPLQGGAQFSVSPNPFDCYGGTDPGTFTDNDNPPDIDPDDGQVMLQRVCMGTYTITEEVAPAGYALDDDTDRLQVVADDNNGLDDDGDTNVDDAEELDAVIGAQENDDDGNSDESDFHNRRGTILFEKRAKSRQLGTAELKGGATFRITPNPLTGEAASQLDVTDGDPLYDAFFLADGRVCVDGVLIGIEYTIEEIASNNPAYAIDDDPTRGPLTVTDSSSCADRTFDEPDVAAFENIPLSELTVTFRSLAGDGVTQLTVPIDCETVAADDTDADSPGTDTDHPYDDPVLDRNEVFTDLKPGIYTCIIDIDP